MSTATSHHIYLYDYCILLIITVTIVILIIVFVVIVYCWLYFPFYWCYFIFILLHIVHVTVIITVMIHYDGPGSLSSPTAANGPSAILEPGCQEPDDHSNQSVSRGCHDLFGVWLLLWGLWAGNLCTNQRRADSFAKDCNTWNSKSLDYFRLIIEDLTCFLWLWSL